MSNCELSRLNYNSFERLVRALAFAEMGPGGVVYSSGADGARDFTFEGRIKGFEPRGWNGYLILQAKYRENLEGGQRDIDWLKQQIDKELKKFRDVKRNLRRPDYYLLATNVKLSGADTPSSVGGHTKISQQLDRWKTSIGLKDHHLWPADQLVDLLSNHPQIRQTFAAWVTPGDVLSEMLGAMKKRSPEFMSYIKRALKRNIFADQYISLNEAGNVQGKKLETSKIFIDLPITRLSGGASIPSQTQLSCVFELVAVARNRLDPTSLRDLIGDEERKTNPVNRIVLLGGPGQGKSTTGLFAAQVFRASILESDPEVRYDPTISEVIPEILVSAQNQGLPKSLPRRFPVYVTLPGYADIISNAKLSSIDPPSLLTHIANDFGKAADSSPVDREDLRSWLATYPWVIILDGLDEVPPAGERPAIISAINALVSEIAEAKADVLLIVTSRPQGYNKDLDERHWTHWQLADLPKDTAQRYAKALSLAQYPLDADRRARIDSGLERAMKQPATARLMVSPLQVTIMHLIVDGGGSAPVGRWALFNEYFQVLKKREKGKGGETLEVLERNWDHLDPVHHRAGLILQTESEKAGGADASFSPYKLQKMIEGFLQACGYNAKDQSSRAKELSRLALNRLVLLSMRQQGQTEDQGLITFDVRSLQEFMAAAQLTTEREVDSSIPISDQPLKIEERLIQIAGISHWRHVFHIAASRCFSDTALTYLRSVIVSIPRSLDITDSDRLARTGARLALEMLEDGIGINHPISRCKLAEHSLELLMLGPAHFGRRLASIWNPDTAPVVEAKLRQHLVEGVTPPALGAWRLLTSLCLISPEHFTPMLEEYWPSAPRDALAIFSSLEDADLIGVLEEHIARAIEQSPPDEAIAALWEVYRHTRQTVRDRDLSKNFRSNTLRIVFSTFFPENRNWIRVPVLSADGPLIGFFMSCVDDAYSSLASECHSWNQQWSIFRRIAEFAANPTTHRLAQWIKKDSHLVNVAQLRKQGFEVPWPLEVTITHGKSESHILKLAELAENGGLGNPEIWLEAETRWKRDGVSLRDLQSHGTNLLLGANTAKIGAPPFSHMFFERENNTRLFGKGLNDVITALNTASKLVKQQILSAIQYAPPEFGKCVYDNPELIPLLLEEDTEDSISDGRWIEHLAKDAWSDDIVVQRIVNCIPRFCYFWIGGTLPIQSLMDAYVRSDHFRPLLYLIAEALIDQPAQRAHAFQLLPSSALDWQEADCNQVRAGVAVLKFLRNSDVSSDVIQALCIPFADEIGNNMLLRLTLLDHLSRDEKERLLMAALSKFPVKIFRLCGVLQKTLDARKSGLSDATLWIDLLKLPQDAYEIMNMKAD